MKLHIVVVGSSNTDLVIRCDRPPRPGETVLGGTFRRFAVSKGANQAVAAARVTFVGARSVAAAARRLRQRGVQNVVVTRGGRGAGLPRICAGFQHNAGVAWARTARMMGSWHNVRGTRQRGAPAERNRWREIRPLPFPSSVNRREPSVARTPAVVEQ